MADQPTSPASPHPAAAGGGNVFTHKLGPLPMWQWAGMATAGLLGWALYKNHKSGGKTGSTTSTTATTAGGSSSPYASSALTSASQVPQFINQTYTTVLPPMAPPPPVAAASTVTTGATTTTAAAVQQYPPPTGLAVSKVTANGVTLTWNATPSGTTYPSSYTAAVYNSKGSLVSETTVQADAKAGKVTTTLTGLPAKTALHCNVWANGGKVAPKGAAGTFTTT